MPRPGVYRKPTTQKFEYSSVNAAKRSQGKSFAVVLECGHAVVVPQSVLANHQRMFCGICTVESRKKKQQEQEAAVKAAQANQPGGLLPKRQRKSNVVPLAPMQLSAQIQQSVEELGKSLSTQLKPLMDRLTQLENAVTTPAQTATDKQ